MDKFSSIIIKAILEDDTIVYKKFSENDLYKIVDSEKIVEYLEDKFGEIESWHFTKKNNAPCFLDIRNFIDDNIIYKINDKVVKKYEFLEKNSYEHLIGSFCSEMVEDWDYNIGVQYEELEYDWEPEDPCSDDPPDYYEETYGL